MAIQSVVVEVHLGIQRKHPSIRRGDERIDLEQRGVGLLVSLVQRHHELHRRRNELRLQFQGERDLARLERPEPDRRIDVLLDDCCRVFGRNFFDLHPARFGRHEHRSRHRPVQHDSQVQFAGNRQRLFDQQPPDLLALRPGLVRHQLHPQHLLGDHAGFPVLLGQLHASALAAPAGMDLRLHYNSRGALTHKVLGGALCCLARFHHRAARHCHSIL